jgi:hypothetical protein
MKTAILAAVVGTAMLLGGASSALGAPLFVGELIGFESKTSNGRIEIDLEASSPNIRFFDPDPSPTGENFGVVSFSVNGQTLADLLAIPDHNVRIVRDLTDEQGVFVSVVANGTRLSFAPISDLNFVNGIGFGCHEQFGCRIVSQNSRSVAEPSSVALLALPALILISVLRRKTC